jgi:hypothetical protein
MKTIYKYDLAIRDDQTVKLPLGAKILSVHEQYGNIIFYALVDKDIEETDDFYFICRGTGHNADFIEEFGFQYLGTVKLYNGGLMFHIFYK